MILKYKQMIIIRRDLNMSPGKMAAQAGHAAVGGAFDSNPFCLVNWMKEGYKKVVLGVDSEEELMALLDHANSLELPVFLVRDFGLTELEPNTITCLAIGPALGTDIDKVTKDLKLL